MSEPALHAFNAQERATSAGDTRNILFDAPHNAVPDATIVTASHHLSIAPFLYTINGTMHHYALRQPKLIMLFDLFFKVK
jgi:hypothetical protein